MTVCMPQTVNCTTDTLDHDPHPAVCASQTDVSDLQPGVCGLQPDVCALHPDICSLHLGFCAVHPAVSGLVHNRMQPASRLLQRASSCVLAGTQPNAACISASAPCIRLCLGRYTTECNLHLAVYALHLAVYALQPAGCTLQIEGCTLQIEDCTPTDGSFAPRKTLRRPIPRSRLRPPSRHSHHLVDRYRWLVRSERHAAAARPDGECYPSSGPVGRGTGNGDGGVWHA